MSLGYMNSALAQLTDALANERNEVDNDNAAVEERKRTNEFLRDLPYKIDNERDEARAAGRWEMELEFEPRMIKLFRDSIQEQLNVNAFENVATLAESAAIFLRRFAVGQQKPSRSEERAERLEKVVETFGTHDPEAP